MSFADIIIHGTLDQVRAAVAAGADVNAMDEYGFTPLIETAIVNNTEMAAVLLDAGAKVDEPDMTGNTALHWAVENHKLSLCELLLKHKANPNAHNKAGQPILLNPILRNQNELKVLLYQHGAKLTFAQDYINTKLLGHRFELRGHVDIVSPKKQFVEIDLEGFFLEFTLDVITHALVDYINHFVFRKHRKHFSTIHQVISAYQNASELIKYQQYLTDLNKHAHAIDELLQDELAILPVNYAGHAITLVRYHDLLAICDRRQSLNAADSIGIFRMQNATYFTPDLMKALIYELKDERFMTHDLPRMLDLTLLSHYPISKQIAGNCSWANVEAALPVALAILTIDFQNNPPPMVVHDHFSNVIFNDWREWDKDRALHFCLESFYEATPARKASKLALLAAILFQRCSLQSEQAMKRARKIVRALLTPGYEYLIESYKQIYSYNQKTSFGQNLKAMLDLFGDDF